MSSTLSDAIEVLASRFGADEVAGIEVIQAYKVVALADRVRGLESSERDILGRLQENIRQANKAASA